MVSYSRNQSPQEEDCFGFVVSLGLEIRPAWPSVKYGFKKKKKERKKRKEKKRKERKKEKEKPKLSKSE